MMPGPTFICPCAQKAGTSWLNRQLKKHPDFWMPPQKEIDYLSELPGSRKKYAARLAIVEERFKDKIGEGWRLEWWRLFTSEWDLNKYTQLFFQANGKLSGDISPNYSGLSAEEVQRAADLLPQTKIVFLLRDPVERAWSHARHTISRGPKSSLPEYEKLAAMIKFAQSPRCFHNGDYATILKRWLGSFGEERVYLAYYDDLVDKPVWMMNNILDFLGAAHLPADQQSTLHQVINRGESYPCPADLSEILRDKYAHSLKQLRQILPTGSRPSWLG